MDDIFVQAEPAQARVGPDGRVTGVNARFARATGLAGEGLDRPLHSLLAERLSPEAGGVWGELLASARQLGGTPVDRVVELPAPDGTSIACLLEAWAEGDDVVLREVPGRGELEAQLVHFRLAAKLGGFGLWSYEPDTRRWRWHGGRPSLIADRGTPPQHLEELFTHIDPADAPRLRAALHALETGTREEAWVSYRITGGPGGPRWLGAHMRRLRLGIGGPMVIVGVGVDETETVRRREEQEVRFERERERARGLAEMSGVLISAVDEDEVHRVLLDRAASVFGGEGTLVALVKDDRLCVTHSPGIDDRIARLLDGMPLDAGKPLPWAIRTGEPVFIPSRGDYASQWPESSDLLRASEARAFAMIPFGTGRSIGGLVVAYPDVHHPTEDEQALMRTLGQLAGQALQRVRLQQARADLAEALQRTMLPSGLPEVEGLEIAVRYRPARDGLRVGGDWYDLVTLSDGTVLCCIGDAQGHDVEAAAYMGQVRTTIRAFASEDPDPSHVLARTNELLVSLRRDRFASCTFLCVDPDGGRCRVARAGHVPLLIVGADGATRLHEGRGGPLLGILGGARYPADEVDLAPGDSVLLITDGLVESADRSLDAGLEHLAWTASHHAVADIEDMADAAIAAADETGNTDDAAVLVLRLTAGRG